MFVARCLDFTASSNGENEKEAIQSLGEVIKEYLLTGAWFQFGPLECQNEILT